MHKNYFYEYFLFIAFIVIRFIILYSYIIIDFLNDFNFRYVFIIEMYLAVMT